MKNLLILLIIATNLVFPIVGNTYEFDDFSVKCNEELKEYFSEPANAEKIKEFIRLKAQVAFNRAAFALFIDDARGTASEKTSFSQSVQRAISKLDKNTLYDPAFKRARESFEKEPLSRKNFAEILPFIKNILNKNLELNSEDRYIYALSDSDIKLFHLLAKVEGKNPTRDSIKQVFDKNDARSVLNFPRRIDNLLSTRNSDIFASKSLKDKISSSLSQMDKFLDSLEISGDCRISCEINVGHFNSHQKILELADYFLKANATDKVKWGDIWINVGKSQLPSKKPPVVSKNTEFADEENTTPNYDLTYESKPTIDHLADKVLSRYAYFFTKEELIQDPELTKAIAFAIDSKMNKISYQGNAYWLPRNVDTDSNEVAIKILYKTGFFTDFELRNVWDQQRVRLAAMNLEPEVKQIYDYLSTKQPNCSTNKDGTPNWDHQVMLALSIYQARMEFDQDRSKQSFVFNKKHCNAYIGTIIEPSKKGFLNFKRGAWKAPGKPSENILLEEQQKVMEEAVKKGEDAYIFQDNVYLVSGLKVPYQEIIPNEKAINLELMKASRNGADAALINNIAFKKNKNNDWIAMLPNQVDGTLKDLAKTEKDISSLDSSFKKSAAVALLSKKPSFIHNGTRYNSRTLNKESEERFIDPSVKITKELEERKKVKESDNEEVIHLFHQNYGNNNCDYYTIVDKPEKKLRVYSNNGDVVWEKNVLTGTVKSDKRQKWVVKNGNQKKTNNITPAGLFTLGDRKESANYYQGMYEGNLIDIIPELGSYNGDIRANPFALHQIPQGQSYTARRESIIEGTDPEQRRMTGGCVNMKKPDMEEFIETFHQKGCPFYVIPEEDHIRFEIDAARKKLSMKTTSPNEFCKETSTNGCSNDYLFSPTATALAKSKPKPIKINYDKRIFDGVDTYWYKKLVDDETDLPLKIFATSVESSKSEIMSNYNMTNDEYNELAKIAIGIMGVESEFGLHKKYLIKEMPDQVFGYNGQDVVDSAKELSNKPEDSSNSRGPTQIKKVHRFIPTGVDISEDDLVDPGIAGLATMHVLINMYNELKRMKDSGDLRAPVIFPGSSEGPTNIADYIYYLYNGDKASLQSGTATPDLNLKVQKMKKYMQYVSVLEMK